MSSTLSKHLLRRACHTLVASVVLHRRGYCDDEGWFNPAAVRAIELGNDGGLSARDVLMLRASLDVWNGEGGVTLAEILHTLDRERITLLCSLIAACNAEDPDAAVRAWLAKYDYLESIAPTPSRDFRGVKCPWYISATAVKKLLQLENIPVEDDGPAFDAAEKRLMNMAIETVQSTRVPKRLESGALRFRGPAPERFHLIVVDDVSAERPLPQLVDVRRSF